MSDGYSFTINYDRYLHPGAEELAVLVKAHPDGLGHDGAEAASAVRIRTPQLVRLASLDLLDPVRADVTAARQVTDQVAEFPLGEAGAGVLLASFTFTAGHVGDIIRLARIEPVAGDGLTPLAGANLVVEWSDQAARIVMLDQELAAWTGRAELAAAIKAALDMIEEGSLETALAALHRASELAARAGDEIRRYRLEELVYEINHSKNTQVSSRITDSSGLREGGPKP
jgi:hypothetical protein